MKQVTFPAIDLSHIRAVMLDIDNCLYPYEAAHASALADCHAHLVNRQAIHLDYPAFKTLYRDYRNDVVSRLSGQGACRSRLLAFHLMFERLAVPAGWLLAPECEDYYWHRFIDAMEPNPQAAAFLQDCRERGVKVCVVSDMQMAVQVRKLKRLGMADAVTFMVTSEEAGVEKPDGAIYARAWEKLSAAIPGLAKSQCIMVGDCAKKDIAGGRAFGLVTYQVLVP